MNEQERLFFEGIANSRARFADAIDEPFASGVKDSIVDKYSDQAHFIYELLQNADDAGATEARFILESDRLIFAHNGKRHFSVTDPSNETIDRKEGKLGDINSITSVGQSNKTEASIGKFGLGFKSVFQYTSEPEIYDRNFHFKIKRLIVPDLLDKDFPLRHPDETLFVFPFNNPKRSADEAYEDILDKLNSLSYPLLFLSNLERIEFEYSGGSGLYGKTTIKSYTFGSITAEYLSLTQKSGNSETNDNILLFSSSNKNKRRYSVGFFLDNKGLLRPKEEPAFCFFPTKEHTGLKFIIHAPFLLTDSREGIQAGKPHNKKMIELLADLAARSIVLMKEIGEREHIRLIDDNVLDIIPYNPNDFSDPNDKNRISFRPFYDSIKQVFKEEAILPAKDGSYVSSKDAYWPEVKDLVDLFSNDQLSLICRNQSARWVFISKWHDSLESSNHPLCNFIESIVETKLNEVDILKGRQVDYYHYKNNLPEIKGITDEFIESQPISWLHKFYNWLSRSKNRKSIAKNKPFFLNQKGKAVAAFDEKNQLKIFLPQTNVTGYSFVHPDLLSDKDTRKFIEDIGIKEPSLEDYIYNIVLPKYKKNESIDIDEHFKLFFDYYYNKCTKDKIGEFISLIKDCAFLECYLIGNPSQVFRGTASSIYFPNHDLKVYFETKPNVKFLALEKYKKLVGESQEKRLVSFFSDLGVKSQPSIESVSIDRFRSDRKDLPLPHYTWGLSYEEGVIDGCKEIVLHVSSNQDREKSVLLWKVLLSLGERSGIYSESVIGVCNFFYRTWKKENFISSDLHCLRENAWLFNNQGKFVTPQNVTKTTLSNEYNLSSRSAIDLMRFLGIKDDEANLTDEQRKKIAFAERLADKGITDDEDIDEFVEWKRQKTRRAESKSLESYDNDSDKEEKSSFFEKNFNGEPLETYECDSFNESNHARQNNGARGTIRDNSERLKGQTSQSSIEIEEPEEVDQDEYTPALVDYEKRIERAKRRSSEETIRISNLERLQNLALEFPTYSYGWFKALLEMENLDSQESNSGNRKVSISFAKAEREPGTKRTLVLKHPDRYIPHFIEELTDVPLVLHVGDKQKTVVIEVANINSYTLRVKLKKDSDLDGVDLATVTEASISVKSPAFLLEELQNQFVELGYDDKFDMKANLCENIEFIFGPPGTGKTTYLAKNVLVPLMKEETDCKVLVLTPTNKAADVLTLRIMETMGSDRSYEDWLVRFGVTGDEELERSGVFRDKTFDIQALSKSITVTTVARFPYDYFMSQGTRIHLNEIKWDYIVFDEASMIPIANIIYPLYKKTPKKFIIAGDPFQIEPIASVNLWKNENIYTLVGLNSFENPKTKPRQYKVELLTTQYRSVPEIGEVFSKFTYGGVLKHARSSASQRPLNLPNDLNIKTLNIIKFPVSKYESVYRAKRLQHSSSYQIYSALFTYEYIVYLSKVIAKANPGRFFKIGVIAPYRAQADLIEKLFASEKTPKEVEVQVSTIHRFQGDECDIIFAVFNTPPTISDSKEIFLNKRNIINVSISRAKDYLFIVMPDDNTENISTLHLVKRVERLIKETDKWTETYSPDLEKQMFGDSNYLENNVFSTSHQSVNVYGLPEKYYEVRTEDYAVDVQIHREAKRTDSNHSSSESVADNDTE